MSPLHHEFRLPLSYSRLAVSRADTRLSRAISPLTYKPAYTPFTPSNSGQRLLPTCHRGCWHVVGRSFLKRYRHCRRILTPNRFFPLEWALQPKGLPHPRGVASSGFRPLRMIPTCASHRGLDLVSVPVWPDTLSGRLPIVALVGRYPTNKLIGGGLILQR